MEVVKRKILLENSTDRSFNSPTWGVMTATSFYIKVMITQNMDDMGLFTDIDYIPKVGQTNTPPDYTILANKLASSGYTFPFMTGGTPSPITGVTGTTQAVLRLPSYTPASFIYSLNLPITGATDSKIEDVRSYNASNPFIAGFDIATETYINYNNVLVNSVSRVKTLGEPKIYVFDTQNDANLGTNNQVYGLQYQDFTGTTRNIVIDGVSSNVPLTTFRYIGEGWNVTNISLSALTKEEYLFGIISPPEVQSDVFIDRGITTVMDRHLRMSEIKNLGELSRYGNGFYSLRKQ